jgi:hypothetical protein
MKKLLFLLIIFTSLLSCFLQPEAENNTGSMSIQIPEASAGVSSSALQSSTSFRIDTVRLWLKDADFEIELSEESYIEAKTGELVVIDDLEPSEEYLLTVVAGEKREEVFLPVSIGVSEAFLISPGVETNVTVTVKPLESYGYTFEYDFLDEHILSLEGVGAHLAAATETNVIFLASDGGIVSSPIVDLGVDTTINSLAKGTSLLLDSSGTIDTSSETIYISTAAGIIQLDYRQFPGISLALDGDVLYMSNLENIQSSGAILEYDSNGTVTGGIAVFFQQPQVFGAAIFNAASVRNMITKGKNPYWNSANQLESYTEEGELPLHSIAVNADRRYAFFTGALDSFRVSAAFFAEKQDFDSILNSNVNANHEKLSFFSFNYPDSNISAEITELAVIDSYLAAGTPIGLFLVDLQEINNLSGGDTEVSAQSVPLLAEKEIYKLETAVINGRQYLVVLTSDMIYIFDDIRDLSEPFFDLPAGSVALGDAIDVAVLNSAPFRLVVAGSQGLTVVTEQ